MYLLLGVLLGWPSGIRAQVATWTELAHSATIPDFMARLQPANYGLADAPPALLKDWEKNPHIDGDSLYQLLRGWNTYPKPRRTGVICQYTLPTRLDSFGTVPGLYSQELRPSAAHQAASILQGGMDES